MIDRRIAEHGHFTGASCPWCGKPKYFAGTLREEGKGPVPTPGDATICISCGKWAIFDERMEMRQPTIAELLELSNDAAVQQATRTWLMMQKAMKGKP